MADRQIDFIGIDTGQHRVHGHAVTHVIEHRSERIGALTDALAGVGVDIGDGTEGRADPLGVGQEHLGAIHRQQPKAQKRW
jgi:hypothetical protein